MAAQEYTSVVQQLYISYFGRPADYFGLQNFSNQLDALGAPKTFAEVQAAVQADKAGTTGLSKLVNTFNNSAESAALYGTDNSQIGISKFVAAIYQNVLGREADVSGFNFWVNAITSGTLTKANAAAAITQAAMTNTSAQGLLDAQTVTNKLAVATAFTDALDTPTEFNAYAGDAAAAAGRSLLSGVNSTTSVTAYQANINDTINNIVNVVTGSTFTVTSNVDTLVGTAGNDVFNALSVKADGTPGPTLNNFDSIDGGAGRDTLNIYTDGTINGDLGGANVSIKNIETINIYNADASTPATGLTDASKYTGVTALWQIGGAADVTNLQAATAAGFRSLVAATTVNVGVVDAAASATIALDGVAEGSAFNVAATTANGKLAAVNLSGNVTDTDTDGTVGNVDLAVAVGKDVQTLTVNTTVATNLTFTTGAGSKALTTIAAGASTGAITYADTTDSVANITTGSGDDVVTVSTATAKDNAATTANETVNAVVNTGAGDDQIDVNVTGDGIVTVNAGDGNDTVHITSRDTATLNINLGAGNDIFTSDVAIGANDKIDAGTGFDTLLLNLVGSANVGAFSNFDAFDANDLGKSLDVAILAQKNTVTEFITTGDVGANAELLNVGAGVGYRITGDTDVANALTITQKTAGDLTVTLNIEETGDDAVTTGATDADAAVTTNATGVKAVFDSSFVGDAEDATDNIAALTITATAAKTIAVVSGGENASNVLTVGAGAAALTAITVTGDSQLTINAITGAAKLASIDASAATGGLVTSLANVIDGGSITLGSGADIITITGASKVGGLESISGFEKTLAVSVSTAAADATAKADAIADADVLSFTGTVAATTTGNTGGDVNAKGVLAFTGSGPASLAAAAAIADTATGTTTGAALVFEYLGDSYVFVQGGAAGAGDDTLVQLTGVTGVTNFAEDGATNHFFIV